MPTSERARPATAVEQFVALSATLTGFTEAEIHGTGMVPTYAGTIPSIVGQRYQDLLLTRWSAIHARGRGDDELLHELIRTELLADPALGPLAVNLTYLWYLGTWNQLPAAWRAVHGAFAGDTTFVVSSQAWEEGLVWPAIGTHPPAAKQPGYGSWALPPADLEVP